MDEIIQNPPAWLPTLEHAGRKRSDGEECDPFDEDDVRVHAFFFHLSPELEAKEASMAAYLEGLAAERHSLQQQLAYEGKKEAGQKKMMKKKEKAAAAEEEEEKEEGGKEEEGTPIERAAQATERLTTSMLDNFPEMLTKFTEDLGEDHPSVVMMRKGLEGMQARREGKRA